MGADPEPLYVYDRATRKLQREPVAAGAWISLAYSFSPDGIVQSLAFKSGFLTRLLGYFCRTWLSRAWIGSLIKTFKINLAECREPRSSFKCFNDFFIRRLKPELRPCDSAPDTLISPVDGRILIYPRLTIDEVIPVKGYIFSIDHLLQRAAPELHNGSAAVIRLNPGDCHRIFFPCGGDIVSTRTVPGAYHSVHPLADAREVQVYCANTRAITILQNQRFGSFAFVEVGAFGVGSIVQTYQGTTVVKGREKGYFQFGGSTVVLVFEKGRVAWADDLVTNSADGYETLVRYGEVIARAAEPTPLTKK